MKKSYLTILLIFCVYFSQAQFGEQQIINIDLSMAKSVHSADIDNDGDMDVISASFGGDKLEWYENLDGLGNFSQARLIANTTDGAFDVRAADIDGDGFIDIVHASLYWNSLTWYKNVDGLGNFIPRFITSGVSDKGIWTVYPGDIDGDGDLDLFYSYYYDDKIVWFENLNGLGVFGDEQIIDQDLIGPQSIKLNDMDGDGDLDLIASVFLEDKVVWYKNLDGQGDFSNQILITTETIEASTVFVVDLDGDNDMDVISSSQGDNKIAWYENLDGLGVFSDQIIISTNSTEAEYVHSEDLDNDGDMDILSVFGNSIAWHENLNGQGNFGVQQIISSEMESSTSTYTGDLDGDGDKDVLSSSWYDGKIAWYENLSPLSIDKHSNEVFSIYPNPTSDILNISLLNQSIKEVKIINLQGINVKEIITNNQIDVSDLTTGMYFVKIESEENSVIKKMIKL